MSLQFVRCGGMGVKFVRCVGIKRLVHRYETAGMMFLVMALFVHIISEEERIEKSGIQLQAISDVCF